MGYILLLIHFSMLYHDTYITSPFIIIFCCSILKKVFFPNEHCFIKKFVHAVTAYQLNPEKPDVPLNKNDAFQKVQKRRVQEKR